MLYNSPMYIFRKKKILNLIGVFLCLLLLTGCSEGEAVVSVELFKDNSAEKLSMLEEAVTDYEVPGAYSKIMVDRNGYNAEEEKTALLVGETLPAVFDIVDEATGETVYHGSVKRKDIEAEDSLSTAEADFSDFDKEGIYYIKTEILGRSESFTVADDITKTRIKALYQKLDNLRCIGCHYSNVVFENATDKYLEVSGGFHTSANGEKDVVEGCLAVSDICTAYEYYPGIFTDDCGIRESGNDIPDILDVAIYEAKWLLKMQNPETGGVYTSVSLQGMEENKQLRVGGETTRATAYFCATMAKFSSAISSFDKDLSKKAYEAALLSWKCMEANKEIVTADQMYRAAVEMYRLTGSDIYKEVVLNYLKDNADKEYEGRQTLDAAITYLGTKRATEVSYCSLLMSHFMERIENKATISERNRYGVESDAAEEADLLRSTYEMMLVDYIVSNSGYTYLENRYIHFLGGRNEKGINFEDLVNTPDALVQYIFLLTKHL